MAVEDEHTTAFFIWSFHHHFVIAWPGWHISILTIDCQAGVQNSQNSTILRETLVSQ